MNPSGWLDFGALGLLALVLVWLARAASGFLGRVADRVVAAADRVEAGLERARDGIVLHEQRCAARHEEARGLLRDLREDFRETMRGRSDTEDA